MSFLHTDIYIDSWNPSSRKTRIYLFYIFKFAKSWTLGKGKDLVSFGWQLLITLINFEENISNMWVMCILIPGPDDGNAP